MDLSKIKLYITKKSDGFICYSSLIVHNVQIKNGDCHVFYEYKNEKKEMIITTWDMLFYLMEY